MNRAASASTVKDSLDFERALKSVRRRFSLKIQTILSLWAAEGLLVCCQRGATLESGSWAVLPG